MNITLDPYKIERDDLFTFDVFLEWYCRMVNHDD